MSPSTKTAIQLFRQLDKGDRLAPELRRFLLCCQREGFPPALVHIAAGTVCPEATSLDVATKLLRLGARMRVLDLRGATDDDDPSGAELVRFLEGGQ
jgi:hypothetical protein